VIIVAEEKMLLSPASADAAALEIIKLMITNGYYKSEPSSPRTTAEIVSAIGSDATALAKTLTDNKAWTRND
jgi:hypothetical protein